MAVFKAEVAVRHRSEHIVAQFGGDLKLVRVVHCTKQRTQHRDAPALVGLGGQLNNRTLGRGQRTRVMRRVHATVEREEEGQQMVESEERAARREHIEEATVGGRA